MTIKYLLRQSNLIEGYDDPEFDAQAQVAWDYLNDLNMPLTHMAIRKVQKILTLRQNDLLPNQRGYYRGEVGNNVNVTIAGRVAPAFGLVPALMDNWLLDCIELDPIAAHVRFEHIHPFVDGNGRTGRLLLWWQEAKSGQPFTPITLAGRQKYYAWF